MRRIFMLILLASLFVFSSQESLSWPPSEDEDPCEDITDSRDYGLCREIYWYIDDSDDDMPESV